MVDIIKASKSQLSTAFFIAEQLGLEYSASYHEDVDETVLRISHGDLHLMLSADGRVPKPETKSIPFEF